MRTVASAGDDKVVVSLIMLPAKAERLAPTGASAYHDEIPLIGSSTTCMYKSPAKIRHRTYGLFYLAKAAQNHLALGAQNRLTMDAAFKALRGIGSQPS